MINIIGSYLDKGESGILNLLSKKYYNPKFKLNINGFIFNDKMREWFCKNFNFNLNIVKYKWSVKRGYLNCLKYAHQNGNHWNKKVCYYAAQYGNLNCLKELKNYKDKTVIVFWRETFSDGRWEIINSNRDIKIVAKEIYALVIKKITSNNT